jgi:hypothetical protein
MQVHLPRVIAMQRVVIQSKLVVMARCTTMGPYRSLGSGRSVWLGGFFLFCFLAASETRALVRASCWTGSLLWGKGGGGGDGLVWGRQGMVVQGFWLAWMVMGVDHDEVTAKDGGS